jgi:lipopolysaccharide export LptBFGC system permease protein LptF
MSLKLLGREPALIIGVVSAALSLVVTLGVGLSTDQAGAIVAVISGVFAAVAAVLTRPIAPAAFTGLVTVAAALLSAYHFNVAPGTVAAINTTVLAILTLLTRGQVSPAPALTRPKAVAATADASVPRL